MKYIIIAATDQSSEQRAELINRELYKISRPNWSDQDVTKYLLSMHSNGAQWVLGFEDTDFIPVNSQMDVTALKNALTAETTEQEKDNLESYIRSNIGGVVFFKDIIPGNVNVYTLSEIRQLPGWENFLSE